MKVNVNLAERPSMIRSLSACLFFCLALLAGAEELEITFSSSFDGSEQKAVAYLPRRQDPLARRPLLVVAHYYGGDRYTARNLGYYAECEERDWFLVCPELHGLKSPGGSSFGAVSAQHDLVDAIGYMRENYPVDESRIYLVGRSMGGQLAALTAAKYPDLFAGVVAGQGAFDLVAWMPSVAGELQAAIEAECGAFTTDNAFEYQRRSAVNYASNLQYVPILLWHGTDDLVVPPRQSELLTTAIRQYRRHQPEVHWLLNAGHMAQNYPPSWICEQLQHFQRRGDLAVPGNLRFYPRLQLVTDEAKDFFWLKLTPAVDAGFGTIDAELVGKSVILRCDGIKEVTVYLDRLPAQIELTGYEVTTDVPVELRVVAGTEVIVETTIESAGAAKWKEDPPPPPAPKKPAAGK